MKHGVILFSVVLAGSVLMSGCGKKEETPAVPTPPAVSKPAPVTPSPAPAAPTVTTPTSTTVLQTTADVKADIDKAMALAKEGKYTDALRLLQGRLAKVQSDPESKKLLEDAIAQIKKMMADAAAAGATKQAEGEATKAIGNLLKR